jgi:di/tricarboxylate transporter
MPLDQIFVCALVLLTVALFAWERISPDVVSMGVLLLLFVVPFAHEVVRDGVTTLIYDPILAPSGDTAAAKALRDEILGKIFGNNAILTVAFMFIVGAAVERTGLVEVLGGWFEKVGGGGGRRTLLALGLLTIPISAFLNNTTVVVVFVPMVLGLCRRRLLMPSRFMIPLSYFAIVGGLCTMIGTSTNILVNGMLPGFEMKPFSIFDITPLGLILAVGTLIFMLLFSRRLLPDRASLAVLIDSESSSEFVLAAIVGDSSPLVGKTFTDSELAAMKKTKLIEVRRSGNRVETALTELIFEAGDRVIVKCHLRPRQTQAEVEAQMKSELGLTYVHSEKAILMEGLIGPQSQLIGRSIAAINFRQQYGVLIVALHREGENQREKFERLKLDVGDTLLLEGSQERMSELFASRDFINLSEVKPKAKPAPAAEAAPQATYRVNRSWIALLALALVVGLGATSLPFEWIALGAAVLVVAGGCLKKDEVYQAIEWRVLIMILGTLALGVAMHRTHADATIIHALMSQIGHWDPRLILSAVLLLTIVFTELLSNNAVAALLTPLAIQLGRDLGVDPRPFVIAVMAGASIGFAIPAGYQTHMLVYSAGGYKFSDFFKIGVLLDVLCWLLGSLAIPLLWPLVKVG